MSPLIIAARNTTGPGSPDSSAASTAAAPAPIASTVQMRAIRRLPCITGTNSASNSRKYAEICPPPMISAAAIGPATAKGTTGRRRRSTRLAHATSSSAAETSRGHTPPSPRNPEFAIPEAARTSTTAA
jgi:hypothetical protein